MSENIKSILLELEKKAWEANKNRDVDFFKNFFADNGLVIFSLGIFDKESSLKDIESNPRELLSYEILEPKLIQLTEKSAAIIYKAEIKSLFQNIESSFSVLITTTYMKVNETWRAAIHQQTPLIQR